MYFSLLLTTNEHIDVTLNYGLEKMLSDLDPASSNLHHKTYPSEEPV